MTYGLISYIIGNMNSLEVYYVIALGLLMVACIASLIVIMRVESGKGIKILLAGTTLFITIICLLTNLVFCGVINFRFTDSIAKLARRVEVPILTSVLTCVSSAEFSCVLYMLIARKEPQKPIEQKRETEPEQQIPEIAKRTKDKRLHGDYKIIKRG